MEETRIDELGRDIEEIVPHTTTSSDGDVEVPEEVEEWVEDTKGVERIISVALSTSKPRTAKWISDQAIVSEQTARDHLKSFSKLGVVASFTSSGVTRYHADEAFLHYREVSRTVEEHTKEEISEMIQSKKEIIRSIKEEEEVESPDDLRAKAASEDADVEDIRRFKKKASDWELHRDELDVLQDAQRRFEKFKAAAPANA